MAPKQARTAFNEGHIIACGLAVCERDESTRMTVVSVSCQFCLHFRREEKIDAKRKATASNLTYFRRPFRADTYSRHMLSQHHSTHWQTYRELTKEQKTVFFEKEAPDVHRNTHKSHFGGSQAAVHYFANKGIVDITIEEMLFHPDDANDDVTKERALATFENVVGQEEDEQDSDLQTDS